MRYYAGHYLTCLSSLSLLISLPLSSSSMDRAYRPWLHPLTPQLSTAAAAASSSSSSSSFSSCFSSSSPHNRRSPWREEVQRHSVREVSLSWGSSVASNGLVWMSTHAHACTHNHMHRGRDVKVYILSDPLFTIGSPTPRLNVIQTLDITHSSPSVSLSQTLTHTLPHTLSCTNTYTDGHTKAVYSTQ